MTSLGKWGLLVGVALILGCGCTLNREGGLLASRKSTAISAGEVRLDTLRIASAIKDNEPFEVDITFKAEGRPQIRRACFRWVTERTSLKAPSLYCYTTEVQNDQEIGSHCARWLAEGPHTHISPSFCAEVQDINYGPPGHFRVRFLARNLKDYYNQIECHVQYLHAGEEQVSNSITAPVVFGE
jgi:hypothetical protein